MQGIESAVSEYPALQEERGDLTSRLEGRNRDVVDLEAKFT